MKKKEEILAEQLNDMFAQLQLTTKVSNYLLNSLERIQYSQQNYYNIPWFGPPFISNVMFQSTQPAAKLFRSRIISLPYASPRVQSLNFGPFSWHASELIMNLSGNMLCALCKYANWASSVTRMFGLYQWKAVPSAYLAASGSPNMVLTHCSMLSLTCC